MILIGWKISHCWWRDKQGEQSWIHFASWADISVHCLPTDTSEVRYSGLIVPAVYFLLVVLDHQNDHCAEDNSHRWTLAETLWISQKLQMLGAAHSTRLLGGGRVSQTAARPWASLGLSGLILWSNNVYVGPSESSIGPISWRVMAF